MYFLVTNISFRITRLKIVYDLNSRYGTVLKFIRLLKSTFDYY